ncbi:MAG: SOS response-associated peptidase [Flavobacteriaceae bacterium]
MCGRMSFGQPKPFNKKFKTALEARYNIAPGQSIHAVSPEGHLLQGTWGIPSPQGSLWVNARSETWTQKPAFQQCSLCWIPAGGWYEWTSQSIPYHFSFPDDWFWVAALRSTDSFVVLTQPAFPTIEHIHNRMPIVMPPEHKLHDQLENLPAYSSEQISFHSVSAKINKVQWEHPDGLKYFPYPEQTSLF